MNATVVMSAMNVPSDMLSGRVSLRRVRLTRGGYEVGSNGRYWGVGQALYVARDGMGGTCVLRAPNRESARCQVQVWCQAGVPSAPIRFYR